MKEVRRDELSPGDHIFSDRKSSLYFHHGIYMGHGMVIHLMGPSKTYNRPLCKNCGFTPQAPGIFKTCMDCFLNGHSLYLFEYNVSYFKLKFRRKGTCTFLNCKPANQVLETARRQLKQQSFGDYNFLLNNCEDFAMYCKTGMSFSHQFGSRVGWAGPIVAAAYVISKAIKDGQQNIT